MPKPWIAEVDVDAELARSLVETQFPTLLPVHLEFFGEGWDNAAYLVNGEWVFRFPRRQLAGPLMESECRLLPMLSPRLPLAIPAPAFVGSPTERYPWRFAGYRKLDGTCASDAGMTEEDRIRLAVPLARFLRALHAIPAEQARRLGAGGDTIGRLDLAKRVPLAVGLLSRFRGDLPVDARALDTILENAPVHYQPNKDTVVHGDLYGRHLLVDSGRNLSGVIDWGDCHVGDRAVDMLPAFTVLPREGREEFFAVYGPLDLTAVRVARARALYHTLNVLNYARDVSDAALEREAATALAHLAEVK